MVRHRRRLPLGIHQGNLYMKDAGRLAGGRGRHDEDDRRENQRAGHEVIVPSRPPDVNAIPTAGV
jgi:hypothetical protein